MSNITLFERNIPIRAIPQKELEVALDTQFKFWIANLLSLKEDKENAYDICKPAIKELCIGMSFVEVKKMFEMYVDSKLNLKPIPNYFDRILLGKIVDSYKSLKKPKPMLKESEITEEEKAFIMAEAVDRIKKEVEHNGVIKSVCGHVYDHLFELGKLPKDKETKDKVFERAKLIAKSEAMTKATESYEEHVKLKGVIEKIEKGDSNVVTIAKRLTLETYFA